VWYCNAKKHTHPLEQIAHKVAQSAVKFWQDTKALTATSNLSIAFSKEMTECLLRHLDKVVDLKVPDKDGIYSNLKNQVESYALLLYLEIGIRYYLLLSEHRIGGELDEAGLKSMIRNEMEQATLDLICQMFEPDDLPEHRSVQEDSESRFNQLKHGLSFPFAEEIDLMDDNPAPSFRFRLIRH
jgi:hypothetical protein